MVEYEFEEALKQLQEYHSIKSNFDEVNKALDYIAKCDYAESVGDNEKAKNLFNEIGNYYRKEINWLSSFERPYLPRRAYDQNQKPELWELLETLRCRIPFCALLKIGKSEIVKNLIKTTIEPTNRK